MPKNAAQTGRPFCASNTQLPISCLAKSNRKSPRVLRLRMEWGRCKSEPLLGEEFVNDCHDVTLAVASVNHQLGHPLISKSYVDSPYTLLCQISVIEHISFGHFADHLKCVLTADNAPDCVPTVIVRFIIVPNSSSFRGLCCFQLIVKYNHGCPV